MTDEWLFGKNDDDAEMTRCGDGDNRLLMEQTWPNCREDADARRTKVKVPLVCIISGADWDAPAKRRPRRRAPSLRTQTVRMKRRNRINDVFMRHGTIFWTASSP